MTIKCFVVEEVPTEAADTPNYMKKYRRPDTGEVFETRYDLPVGALFRDPNWENGSMVGPDAQSWFCMTPGGEWWIDGRASNCTSPCKNCGKPYVNHVKEGVPECTEYIDAKPHKCWVRKGTAPNFTVGKDGPTCEAGAGSIAIGNYHGFLQKGHLTNC